MKLVIGIGNPGSQYLGTRHNVGFEVVERVASRNGFDFAHDRRLEARIARGRLGAHDVWLVEPMTFVNRSGPVVARIARERDAEPEAILVVVDDLNLPLGELRMRATGSAGGHNGTRSLIAQLGDGFPRVRIGIGAAPQGLAEKYVLTRFKPAERDPIEDAYERGANCVEDWVTDGFETAMTRHHG